MNSSLIPTITRESFLNRKHGRKPQRKTYINRKLKECVWERYCGCNYSVLCYCCNLTVITPFTFHCGHIQAESRQGATNLQNLRPICHLCNMAAGDNLMTHFARENGFDNSPLFTEKLATVVSTTVSV